MARFSTFTVGSPMVVLPKDYQFKWENAPETNYIDKLVESKLQKLRITPSGLCTDEVFIRKEGEDVVLSPRPRDWGPYLDGAPAASEAFMEGVEDLPVQEREG